MQFFSALIVAFAIIASAAAAPTPSVDVPSVDSIQASAKLAFDYANKNITTSFACGWTRGTYMIGLWEYYAMSKDADAAKYLRAWGENYNYKLCGKKQGGDAGARRRLQAPCHDDKLPCDDVHNANNELCGATYVEMGMAGMVPLATAIKDTAKVFGEEIADAPDSNNYWSWLDACFMAMNPYARMGAATGDQKYFTQQWKNFEAAALLAPSGCGPKGCAGQNKHGKTFGFWNKTDSLFYRDDRFLGTNVYWGRGNGWAIGGLVAAIQNGNRNPKALDPKRGQYIEIFKMQAAALMKIAAEDKLGVWHSSLLNSSGYPTPEMTGTSSFVYGLAFGINAGILDKTTYLPVATKGYKFMQETALQKDGRYGFCQPVGGSPEHNVNKDSTSDFCVGQFLLASVQMAKLSASL